MFETYYDIKVDRKKDKVILFFRDMHGYLSSRSMSISNFIDVFNRFNRTRFFVQCLYECAKELNHD